MSSDAGQQHPLGVYYQVWILLFVVSFFSYMVDYLDVQGFWRWTLVMFFMVVKAGFIVAIFMHAAWERLALVFTILGPPAVLLLLIGFMAVEGNYTEESRFTHNGHDRDAVALTPSDLHGEDHNDEADGDH